LEVDRVEDQVAAAMIAKAALCHACFPSLPCYSQLALVAAAVDQAVAALTE